MAEKVIGAGDRAVNKINSLVPQTVSWGEIDTDENVHMTCHC